MTSLTYILLIVTLLKSCRAEPSPLEKFLTSGFSKDQTSDDEEDKKKSETSTTDFIKFMKRAGVIGGDNLNTEQQRFLNALETLNPNQAIYYQSQASQPSPLTNYVAPKRQLAIPQQPPQIYTEQQLQPQQQLQRDLQRQQALQALQQVTPEQQLQQQQQLQQELQRQQALQMLQQLTPEQKQILKQQLFLKLQQLQAQRQQVQQQLQSQQSSPQYNVYNPTANDETKDNTQPRIQDIAAKSASKDDREGLYDNLGYDQGYSGGLNDGFSDHQDGYSAGHYSPKPIKEVVYVPKPSLNIKIDPLNILRLLLAGIPKPLLNLNGKVFFGVELGKHVGVKKGVGYAAPHYGGGGGGKGIVLNLG